MPTLEIPQTQGKIRPTPPAQIPYPDYLAGQAYGPLGKLGSTISQIGNAFTEEILSSRAASEMAKAEGDIRELYFKHKVMVENDPDPRNAQAIFNDYNTASLERIAAIGNRGARANVQNWYVKQAPSFQRGLLEIGLQREWQMEREGTAVDIERLKSSKLMPGEALKDRISDTELMIHNRANTFIGGKPVLTVEEAKIYIKEVNEEIPMNVALDTAYPMGPQEGSKWLKENKKKLGLSTKAFGKVQQQLKQIWADEATLAQLEQKAMLEEVTNNIWGLILKNDFESALTLANTSNLSVDGDGGKKFWTDYIRSMKERVAAGTDVPDDPDAELDINEIIDNLWMGRATQTDFVLALVGAEKAGLISRVKRNKLVENAKTELESKQKDEWAAIKGEAKARIISIPSPDDLNWGMYMSTKSQEEQATAQEEYLLQVQKYNDFRMDFIEWMGNNPDATFYDIQEQRLELLYGKYSKVKDEYLKKFVEMALTYNIGDEALVNGVRSIYVGAGRWNEIEESE